MNDCPFCNKELFLKVYHTSSMQVSCRNCYCYSVYLDKDGNILNENLEYSDNFKDIFGVSRRSEGTDIYDAFRNKVIFRTSHIIDFDKISTLDKVKKLLLLT